MPCPLASEGVVTFGREFGRRSNDQDGIQQIMHNSVLPTSGLALLAVPRPAVLRMIGTGSCRTICTLLHRPELAQSQAGSRKQRVPPSGGQPSSPPSDRFVLPPPRMPEAMRSVRMREREALALLKD